MKHMSIGGEMEDSNARSRTWKRWVPLAVLALVIVGFLASGAQSYLSPSFLVRNYADLTTYINQHFTLALCLFALIYVLATALSLPGGLMLTIAGGLFFGAYLGGAVIVASATAGATILFLVARSSLGETMRERAGPMMARLRKGFQEDAVSYLLFLRLVPAFPFWLVNLAPAFFGVRLSTYVLTTLIGILPGTFAYSFVGAGIDGIVAAQADELAACEAAGRQSCEVALDLADLVNAELLIAFAAIGVIALIPVLYKRLGRKHTQGHTPD